jgi:hypothetical protein
VEDGFGRIFSEIEAGLPARRSLTEQLLHVFEIWSVHPFELVVNSPEAEELMSDSFGFASDVFDRSSDRLATLLTRLLRAVATEPDDLDPSAQARAQVLIAAAHGFKSMAHDTNDMRQLIRHLVAMTVAGFPHNGRSLGSRAVTESAAIASSPSLPIDDEAGAIDT